MGKVSGLKSWKVNLVAALAAAVFVLPGPFLSGYASGQALTPADAIALEQQGRLGEAAQAWRSVIQKDPHDAGAFASLGVVLSKEQKYGEAASAYQKAIALNPKLPGIQLNLGLAEFKQGHFQAAIAPLHAASTADGHNLQASTLLGLSYYGAKRFAEATEYLMPASR